jgi:small-conductance mechanosensitive channel
VPVFRELAHLIDANTPAAWLTAGAAACAVYLLLTVLVKIVVRRLSGLAGRTAGMVDDVIVEALSHTGVLFRVVVAAAIGARLLELGDGVSRLLETLLLLTILLQAGRWSSAAISFVVLRMRKEREADAGSTATVGIVGTVIRVALWSVVLLLVLDNLGVDITGLVAGLGITGIAVALAVQNILGDLFASLSIVLDKPFEPGDFIVVDQHLGSVEHIGWKTTRVRSLSGEQLVFSNADLLNSRIRNFKRMQERRVLFTLGVTYDTTVKLLEAVPCIIRAAVEAQDEARFDRAHFKEFGESAFILEAVYYVLSADYNRFMDIQQEINMHILRAFRREGIEFAFPTRTLVVRDGEAAGRIAP